jgi:hypothetical protein
MGNFGFKGPEPVQHTQISGEGIDAAARAAQKLGQTGMQVASGIMDEQRRVMDEQRRAMDEQRRENEALIRARAGNAVLDREIQIKTLQADIEQKLSDGSLRHDQAVDAYNTALQKLEMPAVDGMDPVTSENFNKGMKRVEFMGLSGIQQAAEKAKRVEFKGQTDGALDRLGKLAGMPGADIDKINSQVEALDAIGQVAYGQNWGKVKQDFRDRNWTNQATQRAMQARDSLEDLQRLERDLTEADGFYANKLDPDKRNAVLRTVIGDRMRLENRMQHDADQREARAEKAIGEIDRQIASGVPATAEMWKDWLGTVKGTAYEGEFKKRLAEEGEVQKVLRLPVDQQLAFVQQREAKLLTGGGTVRDQANLSRLKGAVEANVKQLQEAPLLFNQSRTGVAVKPINIADLADPNGAAKIAGQMRDRVASIIAMQKQYGPEVQMRPLLPQEAQILTRALDQASPRQQVDLFGTLRKAFDDDSAYTAAMQQIAPDSPVKALAGILVAKQRKITLESHLFSSDTTAMSGDIAATLLEGEALLNKTKGQKAEDGKAKNFPLPPEKDFRDEFSGAAGRVFAGRPQAYEVAMQAVRAYYTGKAAQDGDVSGQIDGGRMKQAITAVLGEVVNYNGNGEVLAPWGMDKSTFKDKVVEAFRTELRTRGMPASMLDSLPALGLRNKGDGTYYVIQGRNYLYDQKGKPIIINLNGQTQPQQVKK